MTRPNNSSRRNRKQVQSHWYYLTDNSGNYITNNNGDKILVKGAGYYQKSKWFTRKKIN